MLNVQNISIMATIIVYLAFMVAIGIIFSKRNQSSDDFYLGGRRLGPLVTAMSAEASDMSSYLLMGLPGLAYLSGMADVTWTAIGLAVGTYLNWLFVSKRLRRYSAKIGSITIPDFFTKRFHDGSHALETIAALVIIVFFVPYVGSGFAACGKLFNSLFGVTYWKAMVICGIIIAVYTMLGGFMAASFTDLIQSIIMTIAIVVVLVFGIASAGGVGAVVQNAQSLPGYFHMNMTYLADSGTAAAYGPITVISTVAWGLGYFGMPHILLRFMAIRDESKLKLSRRIASIWVVIAMFIAIAIGIIGKTMSDFGLVESLSGSGTENIIIRIAYLISQHGVLAAIVAGLILAGILAATMSTADSQLLAASSSVTQNIIGGLFGKKLEQKTNLIIARVTVSVIAVVGMVIARDPNSSVFGIVSFAWAGFGAAFGPLMLLSLFWKRTTRAGALAGMIGGGAMIFIWKFGVRPLGGALNIYELLPAFIVSIVLIIVVSLATKAPEKAIVEEFESV
ncbi:MAG: sodium/proline symporter [Lachnospiraceae bacterium]|nr:sodium/proline symporter [Lachnospiraceae bacterium]